MTVDARSVEIRLFLILGRSGSVSIIFRREKKVHGFTIGLSIFSAYAPTAIPWQNIAVTEISVSF